MTSYSQFARPASWFLLFGTLGVAFVLTLGLGIASAILALLQHFFTPGEHPFAIERLLWLAATIIAPAIFLARFYLEVAVRLPSRRFITIGWIASASYHAGLTWLQVAYMPATVQSSDSTLKMPLSFFSAAAVLISLYLVIRFPRPPGLPPSLHKEKLVTVE